ncbi:hypothetical protein LIV57_06795 [Chryseobacterium sp. X308]|uniref:hypothetical protein n=1 Tax=Chryseobacterium sp. X308 TaxID=2884873 RepID=UPI001D13F4B7|nr:hypothetical protein [Chryseobacterium sp. X308]MCC3214975.1 hypothetical protein [Chryseobacterium sp. X308]
MSHQEKQEIFDQYAKSNGFDCWAGLQSTCDPIILKRHVFRACDLVQEEQQKRIAENVNSETIQTTFGPFECYDKDSIINPENLIS